MNNWSIGFIICGIFLIVMFVLLGVYDKLELAWCIIGGIGSAVVFMIVLPVLVKIASSGLTSEQEEAALKNLRMIREQEEEDRVRQKSQ